MTTDQGKEFQNELNKQLTNSFGIKHRLTTTYHPGILKYLWLHIPSLLLSLCIAFGLQHCDLQNHHVTCLICLTEIILLPAKLTKLCIIGGMNIEADRLSTRHDLKGAMASWLLHCSVVAVDNFCQELISRCSCANFERPFTSVWFKLSSNPLAWEEIQS